MIKQLSFLPKTDRLATQGKLEGVLIYIVRNDS